MRYQFGCDECGRSFVVERPAFKPPSDPLCECGAVARRIYRSDFIIKGSVPTNLNPKKKVLVKSGTAAQQEAMDKKVVAAARQNAKSQARERKLRRIQSAEMVPRASVPVHVMSAIQNQEGRDALHGERARETLKKYDLWFDD